MLKGDVCLRADINHTHILGQAAAVVHDSRRGSGWGTPENLDDDRVSPDGFHHRLIMFDFGQAIYLEGKQRAEGFMQFCIASLRK